MNLLNRAVLSFSSNKERLKRLGKVLSPQSKQYRAKRIKINLITNGIAYMTEMLGGIVVIGLVFLFRSNHRLVILNIGTSIWYAIIIPSCYLMNSNEIKDSIMEHGWTNMLRETYAKKTRKYEPKSPIRKVQTSAQSIKDGSKTNLSTSSNFIKPDDSPNSADIANNADTKPESAPGVIVNEAQDKLRNELIIYDIETDYSN